LSGYNLAQVFNDNGRFNLNKLICGSEGTLAVVSELTLKVTPSPRAQTLFALRYDSFDDALRDAKRLVTFDPTAIESLDDKVMGLARDNPIYARVRDMIENPDGSTPMAVNLVEFSGGDATELEGTVKALQSALDEDNEGPATGYYRADSETARAALWDLRKGGVGLLGSTPGDRKPLPFVEDTVVDPSVLPAYIRDFRAVLNEYGLEYGMFGHIDVGCLHVRPALNLCDPDDERIMREVTDRVEGLVRRYGGLLWNEHGKGFRSQYNPDYFGDTLYAALSRVKRAFDAHEQINPGKIVAPETRDMPLAAMDATTRGNFNREIPAAERRVFSTTINCNGNGACFNYDPRDVMCPSYRVTRDRLHSPKGRAEAMREWLRQMAHAGYEPSQQPPGQARPLWTTALRGLFRGRRADLPNDFSHEVWTAMDVCLSCRACATQCPIKVDVPSFKSRFLAHYHARYPRPPADYALAVLEPGAKTLARVPGFANALAGSRPGRALLARVIGISDAPAFSRPGLHRYLRAHPQYRFSQERFRALPREAQAQVVFIVQDPFTSFFDAGVVIAVVRLIAQLGCHPLVLPFHDNGKALQVKGFLPEFKKTATRMADFLQSIAAFERPIIGIDPSVTLTYREEYPDTLGGDAVSGVELLEEWLARTVQDRAGAPAEETQPTHRLLQHCTAATVCPGSALAWQRVFTRFGLSLGTAAVGCCGMSGVYGHESRHQNESRGIFDLSWNDAFHDATATPVVPGYSCRSQIRRFGRAPPRHPAEILLDQAGSEGSV
jgi:Fe-S oxidoreductase